MSARVVPWILLAGFSLAGVVVHAGKGDWSEALTSLAITSLCAHVAYLSHQLTRPRDIREFR